MTITLKKGAVNIVNNKIFILGTGGTEPVVMNGLITQAGNNLVTQSGDYIVWG